MEDEGKVVKRLKRISLSARNRLVRAIEKSESAVCVVFAVVCWFFAIRVKGVQYLEFEMLEDLELQLHNPDPKNM